MKKLKLMTVFFAGIIGFFILTLTIHAKTELFVEINPEKNRIVFKNQDVDFSKESMKVYELITEEEEVLSHHILSFNEVYGIILYKTYIGEKYTLEGYVVLEEGLKTCLQKISKEEYEYLINEAQSVLDTSELGMKLKKNQGRFEAYHTYVLDNPITNDGIEGYALERHNRSIQTMTNTDEYIKGYYPSYESSSPYIRTYTDNIINIIPENWFFKEGNYAYVGKEYAVAVSTKPAKSHSYDNDCMLANVGVFDIDVALPYLYRSMDSPIHIEDGKDYISLAKEIHISIKPIINLSYYAYEKKNFPTDYWYQKFDISEDRTVVARKSAVTKIYIAPKTFGIILDDSKSTQPNNMRIEEIDYNIHTSSKLNLLLEQLDLLAMGFTSFSNLSSTLLRIGILKNPSSTDLNSASLLAKAIISFGTMYINDQIEGKKEILRGKDATLKNDSYDANYRINYNSFGVNRPICFMIDHTDFNDIFKSEVLDTYTHDYVFELGEEPNSNWVRNPNYFYDIIVSGIFDFYDNYNFKLGNISNSQVYKNVNKSIDNALYLNSLVNAPSILNGTQISTNLSNDKPSSTIIFISNFTGLTELKINTSIAVIADVYDENGHLIQTNASSYTFNSSLLLRLEKDNRYFIFIRFGYETAGNVFLKFKKIAETYQNLPIGYATHNIRGDDSTNVQYFFFNLTTGGMYSFYTRIEDDTTIRIYDENLRVLAESFNPNADWNEEEPDLNAHCYLNSEGGNRKIIIGIFRNSPQDYHLYTNYFNKYD